MPTDQELSKLSDEHKTMLAHKCVDLLMRGRGGKETEVLHTYVPKGGVFNCTCHLSKNQLDETAKLSFSPSPGG